MKYLFMVLLILFVIFYFNIITNNKKEGFKLNENYAYDIYQGNIADKENIYAEDIQKNYNRDPANFNYDCTKYINGNIKYQLISSGRAVPVNDDLDCYRKCFYLKNCQVFEYNPKDRKCILGTKDTIINEKEGDSYVYIGNIENPEEINPKYNVETDDVPDE